MALDRSLKEFVLIAVAAAMGIILGSLISANIDILNSMFELGPKDNMLNEIIFVFGSLTIYVIGLIIADLLIRTLVIRPFVFKVLKPKRNEERIINMFSFFLLAFLVGIL